MNTSITVQPYIFDCTDQTNALLNLNEYDEAHCPAVIEQLKEYVKDNVISKYNTDYTVHDSLISELSIYNNIPINTIILNNGADESIKLLIETYLHEKSTVLIKNTTYGQYERFSNMRHIKIIKTPSIEEICITYYNILQNSNDDQRVLCFICTPNNPSGEEVSTEFIEHILNTFPNVIFVIDRTYIDYQMLINNSFDEMSQLIHKYSNIFIIRSFSKAFGMAGMRLGYIISNPVNITTLNTVFNFKNVSEFTKKCGLLILENKKYYEQASINMYNEKRILIDCLNKFNVQIIDTICNFVCVKVDNVKEFVNLSKQKNILIRDVSKNMEGYVRITIGNRENNNKLCNYISEYFDGRFK